MEAWILDARFQVLDVVDAFNSFIWTERFLGYGDFELYIPIGAGISPALEQNNYVTIKNSDVLMIIENIEVSTDNEEGAFMTVSGRSLESILDRRVVWGQKTFENVNLQTIIQELLTENVIAPSIAGRAIPYFTFNASTDTSITSLTAEIQLLGESLYDVITALCEVNYLGFDVLPVIPDSNNINAGFTFNLRKGVDRSYDQNDVPWVMFSPNFENLLKTNYYHTLKDFKNSTLVGGEGEGAEKKLYEVTPNNDSGLARRETYTSSNASSKARDENDEEYELTEAEYNALLETDGLISLMETTVTTAFEGEIDSQRQFIYGKDFFLGDIVHVVNEFGLEAKSRVSEIVRSHDINGETLYPTFTAFETEF